MLLMKKSHYTGNEKVLALLLTVLHIKRTVRNESIFNKGWLCQKSLKVISPLHSLYTNHHSYFLSHFLYTHSKLESLHQNITPLEKFWYFYLLLKHEVKAKQKRATRSLLIQEAYLHKCQIKSTPCNQPILHFHAD